MANLDASWRASLQLQQLGPPAFNDFAIQHRQDMQNRCLSLQNILEHYEKAHEEIASAAQLQQMSGCHSKVKLDLRVVMEKSAWRYYLSELKGSSAAILCCKKSWVAI